MSHGEKHNKSWNKHIILFLPVTGSLFSKKTLSEKPKKNSLDFHLDIINKIDKLLAEHNLETVSAETVHVPPAIPIPRPIPIEPRPPLNKTFTHQEVIWEPQITQQAIPEEFKTELTVTPEFRFITKQEFAETISQMHPSKADHIEIIDVNSLMMDNTTSQKNIDFKDNQNQTDETQKSFLIDDISVAHRQHKKIEVIDAGILKQKIPDKILKTSQKQTEEIDEKAQVFFLNKKNSSNKKQRQFDTQQSYMPDDFEERWKKLKENRMKEKEEQRQKEKRTEEPKQQVEKIEIEKLKNNAKKLGFFQKEKKISDKTHPQKINPNQKKQERERLRLQRLEIRQARIEERLRKKQEKHLLKIKQKQQLLKQKQEQKQQHQNQKTMFSKKEQKPQSLEFDEEVKKVLLMTDTLLEELPEDILTDFMHSEDFQLYAKVLNKFKAK